jgi:cation:H+ antiporter
MTLSPYLQSVLGLLLLFAGGDLLVRGASRLARVLGISPLVVGLTVVAFGTSAPEAAVSVKASFAGTPGLALGNVVGSNIFNILFVLGLTALMAPIPIHRQLIRLDLPVMMGASLLVCLLSLNGTLGVAEGIVLLAALAAYVLHLARQGRDAPGAPHPAARFPLPPPGPPASPAPSWTWAWSSWAWQHWWLEPTSSWTVPSASLGASGPVSSSSGSPWWRREPPSRSWPLPSWQP